MNTQDEKKPYILHNGAIILEVNGAFCELFRYTPEMILSQPIIAIIAGDDFRALATLRGKHIVKHFEEHPDRVFEQDYSFVRHDGTRFWGTAESRFIEPGRYLTLIEWEYNIDEY
jgi:PAS domain S-box-containing protein